MRIPLFIDVNGMNVLVLGGGNEAVKKTRRFLKHGARVAVYGLEFNEELLKLAEGGLVKLMRGDVRDRQALEGLIRENDIIIYTVPDLPEVEDWVIDACKRWRKLYVISTDAKKTQVVVPVEAAGAGLRIAVTSEGRSTLVAKLVAEEISKYLEGREDLKLLLDVMGFLKDYMKENKIHYKVRMEVYRELFLDGRLRGLVNKLDREGAMAYVIDYVDKRARRAVQ